MGLGPFRSGRERRLHEERIEARHTGDFYPASELSGEIILLLLLCGCIMFLFESVGVFWFRMSRTSSTLRMGLLLYAKGVTDRWQHMQG